LAPASNVGAALALVHGLHPSDRDGATLLDEVGAQMLRTGHLRGPRVLVPELSPRRVHGEVGRRDLIEIVPGDGGGHGHARTDPRAVDRDHRGSADPRRVDEYLAATVLLHECRR